MGQLKSMNTKELYYQYWGKASKEDNSYHLLPYHCLDVAAVESAWWQHNPILRNSFIKSTGLTEEQTRAWVLFFITFHDFAKLDMRFQMKVPCLSP
jgi:CRISPR-associated endonuclease/helicase Cas3